MKLLHLDSSILGTNSASRELGAAIVARWQRDVPGIAVVHRDLAANPLPHLSGTSLALADAEEAAMANAALDEFLSADVIVIGVPMYNFGVPVQLKTWIDAIARAGVTFRYTENGPEGLIKGKKVYVALARGGIYRDTPADSQVPYLKGVLGFLGMTDVEFIYAEGLAMGPESADKAFAAAEAAIGAVVA